jgi:hypothetical protein
MLPANFKKLEQNLAVNLSMSMESIIYVTSISVRNYPLAISGTYPTLCHESIELAFLHLSRIDSFLCHHLSQPLYWSYL